MFRSFLCVALLASASAFAGQRPFTWGYDTDVVPEGDVELEQWLWGQVHQPYWGSGPTLPPSRWASTYYVWWSPVVGIGEHLELAFPFEVYSPANGADYARLEYFSVDARWRLRPRSETGGLQGMVRAAWLQSVTKDLGWYSHGQVDLIGSYGGRKDVHVSLDVQGSLDWASDTTNMSGSYDLGIAFPLADGEFQIGAESYGQLSPRIIPYYSPLDGWSSVLSSSPLWQVFVGPDLAWTHGRFWITAGVLIGLTNRDNQTPQFMPRLIWAVAL